MASRIGLIRAVLNLDSAGFRQGLERASSASQRFQKKMRRMEFKMKRFGRKMESVGRSMTFGITMPLAAAGGAAVKSAADFESSFANIRKTVDATEDEFAQISDGMRDLAKTIPTPVEELNKLGGVAGQLGIEADNIVGFTETLAKLADTTDVVGEQGALKLSRFMNVMDTAQSDIDRLGSTIVGLGNNFAAMESEIIETATSMAPLGNSIGLTEQQVLAFSTTIAASGGKIRAASTAFQKTANTMKQAVIEGNENLETFAETAGMTASEFQTAFQEDAAGALQSFLEGLREVQKEGGSVATVLDQVGLADQRLVREFGKVLGNLDDLNRALPKSNQFWRENTALTEEAQQRYSTLISRAKILKNRFKDLGRIIGNTLTPIVNKMITASTNAIKALENMSSESRKQMLKMAGLFALTGPVALAIGKFVGLLASTLRIVRKIFVTMATIAASAMGRMGAAFVLGITIGQKFVNDMKALFSGNFDEMNSIFSGWADAAVEAVERVFGPIVDLGDKAFSKLVEGIGEMTGMDDALKQFWKLFEEGAEGANESTKKLGKNIDKMLSDVQKLLDFLAMDFSGGFDGGGSEDQGEGSDSNIGLSQETLDTLQFATHLMNNSLFPALENVEDKFQNIQAFGHMLGNALRRAVVHGNKLGNIFASIGRQLASKGIMTALSFLLPGGAEIGESGFFDKFFGGVFHDGGVVPGPVGQERLILAQGGETVLTPEQMRSGGAVTINPTPVKVFLGGKELRQNQQEVKFEVER